MGIYYKSNFVKFAISNTLAKIKVSTRFWCNIFYVSLNCYEYNNHKYFFSQGVSNKSSDISVTVILVEELVTTSQSKHHIPYS